MADLKGAIKAGSYIIPKTIQLSEEGMLFMNKCLVHDPAERISLKEMSEDPYINEENFQLIQQKIPPSAEHAKFINSPNAWIFKN